MIIEINGRKVLDPFAGRLQLTQRASRKALPLALKRYPPCPGRFKGHCTAVTSISPNPARQQRQLRCLKSWSEFGVPIIVVNTAEEITNFKSQISNLEFVVSDDLTTEYDRPTQRVSTLIDIGRQTGRPFLLLNSDIEICGDPQLIWEAIASPEKLTIGIRHNHDAGQCLEAAELEPWGLDCFLMTPALAATIPDLAFGLGKPAWDYWLPHHFRERGHAFHWIDGPLFFHERHALGWSQAEWLIGARMIEAHYGFPLVRDCAAFRASL